MDRNNVLAFALSMLVFAGYLMYQSQHRHNEPSAASPTAIVASEASSETGTSTQSPNANSPSATAEGASTSAAVTASSSSSPSPSNPVAADPGSQAATALRPSHEIAPSVHSLENSDVIARISNGPAMIEGWSLVHYDERLPGGAVPVDLVDPALPILSTQVGGVSGGFAGVRFEVVQAGPREISQRAESESGVLTRTLRLDESGYGFDIELAFESRLPAPVDAHFALSWPARTSNRPDFRDISLVAYGAGHGVTRTAVPAVGKSGFLGFGGSKDGKQRIEAPVQWAGFDVAYFTGVVMDAESRDRLSVVFEAVEPTLSARADLSLPSVSVAAAGSMQESLRGFFGPKDPAALEKVGANLAHSVNRGWSWLEPLTRFFEMALEWLYRFIPNYGLAVIVLTIMVRMVTAPLMMRQMRSAERMRAVQPRMKALQERYKDDRQRQSEELMKLYKEEGINPLGGCLPLLLQFPVLVGLFYALRSSIGLRHAHFVSWIDDLSQPDLLFTLPGADFPVRLLPLLMGASMYAQQKMTPTTGMDPAQARMMLVMMPAMMLLISYTFPSGLVLYWTVSNLLGIGHQYWIRRQTQPQA